MTKALVAIFLFTNSLSAFAANKDQTLVECIVGTLHDATTFEESFTANEYPFVSLVQKAEDQGLEFNIGSSTYHAEDGTLISLDHGASKNDKELWVKVSLSPSEDPNRYELTANTKWNKRSATLKAINAKGKKTVVADLVCWGRYLSI